MKIAPHHIPGTRQHDFAEMLHPSPPYTPAQDWPEDCTVQWGNGIYPAVAFFEAFIPGTFIRGEGETIAEAETNAFHQYEREKECRHHWGRWRPNASVYLNGAGWCRHCGAYRSRMFKPVVRLGNKRRPLNWMETITLNSIKYYENLRLEKGDLEGKTEKDAYTRSLDLRARLFGITERNHDQEISEEDS